MLFKMVSSGQSVDDAAVITQTLQGNSLKPPAPVHLRGSRNAAGDLLIEWTRRERIAGGLRDNVGTAMSEESEIYVVEIYSGSTLLRTIRDPKLSLSRTVSWSELYDLDSEMTINSDQSITCDSNTSNPVATSNDTFLGDFTVEFTRNANLPLTYLGIAPLTFGHPDNYGAGLFASQGYPYYFVQGSGGNFRPMGNASYQATSSDGDKFTIQRTGSVVHFYKNAHLFAVPVPQYETTFTDAGSLRLFAKDTVFPLTNPHEIEATSIKFSSNRGYNYTANQQVEDFGSTQSSIKVRVMQESAIVGKGNYIEAVL